MQPNNQIKISFKLKDIVIPRYSFNIPQGFKVPEPGYPFTFEINSGILFNEEKKLCIIVLHTKTFYEPEKENLICELITQTVFEIDNFSEVMKKDGDTISAPDQIITTFISISISTTRGIYMMKNSENFLHKVLVPIINPNELFRKTKTDI